MRAKILLFLSLPFLLNAALLPYDELMKKPRSLAKDYYIYRLLDESENLSGEQIKALEGEIFRRTNKITKKFDEFLEPDLLDDNCSFVTTQNILEVDESCQKSRMEIWFIRDLDNKTRALLAKKFKDNLQINNLLLGFNEDNPAKYFAKSNNVKNFYLYFLSLKSDEQEDKFNFALSKEFASNLVQEWWFGSFVADLTIGKRLKKLSSSLLLIDKELLKPKDAFMLGVNAVVLNKKKRAKELFLRASDSDVAIQKDNAIFWLYLLSKDKSYLETLSKSSNINIYSLYAKELLKSFNITVVVPNPTQNKVPNYNNKDPFDWVNLKAKVDSADDELLRKLKEKFYTKETVGEYTYISNKLERYTNNYYPMPFKEILDEFSLERKALIFAIARQESFFISSAISTSYALGVMQFMPFVAKDIATKEQMKNFDSDDMFNPIVAYNFANIHLDYLNSYLLHPVFVAYAYNGGIGFTKRMLLRGDLFNSGEYEPFLSMELVPYAESRDYGKRVLANYIIYLEILSKESNTSIVELLQNLTSPLLSDRFRSLE